MLSATHRKIDDVHLTEALTAGVTFVRGLGASVGGCAGGYPPKITNNLLATGVHAPDVNQARAKGGGLANFHLTTGKAGMRIVGRPAGPVRPPLTDLSADEQGELARIVRSARAT